ncbi:hypothetical protein PROH_16835 [Prochlorothrix hollandica PCC 9006 = CALU 1027]|uniref:Uncharacterized protein n=1 Tax=Prochlorothrix hollandica PCC 9006 = CALU 1027 TaxID=317619 RepID=A0A0M2PQR2_PROHO|nr:hypothetical protein PROH_16835 [Prochlorothrix hollandica PCC 9006 = CALU 1027]
MAVAAGPEAYGRSVRRETAADCAAIDNPQGIDPHGHFKARGAFIVGPKNLDIKVCVAVAVVVYGF